MKLGYSTWGMPMLSVDEQIHHVADLGYQGIELICIANSTTDVEHVDAAERRRIRRLLDASGLALPSIAGSADPLATDPETLARNIRRIEAGVDLASDLAGPDGAPCLVIMAYGQPERYEQDREMLAGRFTDLAIYAQERDVVLALETHVGQAIDLPERALWLLNQVDHPNLKLNLDTSHFDVMGLSIAESVRPLVHHAVHTHVKDQRGRYPQHEYLTPGDGDYDYVAYLKEMHEGGYTGFITAEISLMVQRKPGYDPVTAARQSYASLSSALSQAGLVA